MGGRSRRTRRSLEKRLSGHDDDGTAPLSRMERTDARRAWWCVNGRQWAGSQAIDGHKTRKLSLCGGASCAVKRSSAIASTHREARSL